MLRIAAIKLTVSSLTFPPFSGSQHGVLAPPESPGLGSCGIFRSISNYTYRTFWSLSSPLTLTYPTQFSWLSFLSVLLFVAHFTCAPMVVSILVAVIVQANASFRQCKGSAWESRRHVVMLGGHRLYDVLLLPSFLPHNRNPAPF
jgi:hypothetical protein